MLFVAGDPKVSFFQEKSPDKVQEVRIRSNTDVKFIEFVMEDGVKRAWGSDKSGREFNPFILDHEEKIVKLEIWQNETLNGLVICTNRKSSRLFGSAKGQSQEFAGTLDNPITCINVETGGSLLRITGVELLQLPGCDDSAEQVHALLSTLSGFSMQLSGVEGGHCAACCLFFLKSTFGGQVVLSLKCLGFFRIRHQLKRREAHICDSDFCLNVLDQDASIRDGTQG
jgi:hypothetical protein